MEETNEPKIYTILQNAACDQEHHVKLYNDFPLVEEVKTVDSGFESTNISSPSKPDSSHEFLEFENLNHLTYAASTPLPDQAHDPFYEFLPEPIFGPSLDFNPGVESSSLVSDFQSGDFLVQQQLLAGELANIVADRVFKSCQERYKILQNYQIIENEKFEKFNDFLEDVLLDPSVTSIEPPRSKSSRKLIKNLKRVKSEPDLKTENSAKIPATQMLTRSQAKKLKAEAELAAAKAEKLENLSKKLPKVSRKITPKKLAKRNVHKHLAGSAKKYTCEFLVTGSGRSKVSCGLKFKTNQELQNHMNRRHLFHKPYKCPVKAGFCQEPK